MAAQDGSGGSGGVLIRARGNPNDHYDNAAKTFKKLMLGFPLLKVGEVPTGASIEGAEHDSTGRASEAFFVSYVNPRQLSFRQPTRSQIIQTLGGAYVDSFGFGLPTGQLQGSFGWGMDAAKRTGLDRAATLKKLYEDWQQLTVKQTALCHLILAGNANETTGISMLVFLGDLEMTRSQNSPLTIDYSLSFTVMRDMNSNYLNTPLPPIGTIVDGSTPANNSTPR